MEKPFGTGVIVNVDSHMRQTPTDIAEEATVGIIKEVVSIAIDSPDFIVEQVAAFRERIRQVIFNGVNRAVHKAINKTEKQFLAR